LVFGPYTRNMFGKPGTVIPRHARAPSDQVPTRSRPCRPRKCIGARNPIEDVAARLGYAEASSFIHAFKRWKGVTPAAFAREG
jgi:AraC-like DNA-binding protein